MGSSVEKTLKRGIGGDLLFGGGGLLTTGASKARRAAERQSASVNKQQTAEQDRLQVTEDELARRQATSRSRRGGRRSLIATSTPGLAATLGGGTNG